jgi:hypothetical protein
MLSLKKVIYVELAPPFRVHADIIDFWHATFLCISKLVPHSYSAGRQSILRVDVLYGQIAAVRQLVMSGKVRSALPYRMRRK